MYKIIACDLDETLIRKDRTISAEDRNAVRQAVEKGVKFVPATGRGYGSIDGTLRDLGLYNEPNQYAISFNGGAITENREHRLLHFQGISFSLAQALYQRGLDYDVCIHVYTKDMVYAYNFVQEEVNYLAGRMEIREIFERNIDFLQGQEIVKCLYMNTDAAYLRRIAAELSDITGDVDVSYSSNRYLEFNQKGVTKGEGLRRLAKLLGVDMRDTIAIGDNYNDLSMIRAAGLGIGVQNTVEAMKPECDMITEATCDENAVAEVIEKYILRES